MRLPRIDVTSATLALCMVALLTVAYQQLRPKTNPAPEWDVAQEPCTGEPIVVSYAFDGGISSPHECKVQCEDQKPRYILYSNGIATQCEELPGCNDWGEDHGVTCLVPEKDALATPGSSQ